MYEKKQTLLNNIRTKKNQLKTLELDTTKKINNLQLQIEDIGKQLIELNKLSIKSVKSEIDGQVTAISIHQHETVNQSQKLLTIIPTNSTLKAQLLVPPQSIGFVKIGNEVSIRFDAYSYQKYGQGTGKISNISKTTVNSKDLEKSTAIPFMESQAYYIVDVTLDQQYLNTGKDKQSLESGMTISADIKLENRKLYEWILNPLYSLKERN